MDTVNLMPGDFVIVNVLIVTVVVLSYAFIRRGSLPPVRLNLKARRGDLPDKGKSLDKMPGQRDEKSLEAGVRNPSRVAYRPRRERGEQTVAQDEKDLNVLFNWNGHTWDAYEVLGLPAGSSPTAVKKAFERLATSVQAESLPFITAAYEAIQRHR